ncbi:MAG: MarR family transcriptional regulator [Gammaproteobacteria bacterium]
MASSSEEKREEHCSPDHVELPRFTPYRLYRLSRAVSGTLAEIFQVRFGLSVYEWRCVAVLGNYQPMSANEICERADMDKVQVSRALAKLVENGLVLRSTNRQDRRRSRLRLSARGKRLYQKIVPLAKSWEAKLLAALSEEEQQQLDRIIAKLHQRVDELKH